MLTETPLKPFNKLTPAEAERLAILAEECAEVIQAIGKIQRHGYESYYPDKSNRTALTNELGHVMAAGRLMAAAGDIEMQGVLVSRTEKLCNISQYLHHNEVPEGLAEA